MFLFVLARALTCAIERLLLARRQLSVQASCGLLKVVGSFVGRALKVCDVARAAFEDMQRGRTR